ncbi:MAG: rhamnogalacturonan lyase [Prevotella sp.]|nr:rhamnogalacturonan lyase [Prevotella sp.]
MKKEYKTLVVAGLALCCGVCRAQGQAEHLDRGVVAVKSGTGTFVSWRLLGSDSDDITFDLLRDGRVIQQGLTVTNVSTTGGTDESQYQVVVRQGGEAVETSAATTRWGNIFKAIRLDRPASQSGYHYFPNDCAVGDLDGDGQYELVIKWDPSNCQDNAISGRTGRVYLDAYKLDGTRLWRIDLGQNIRAGAHYTQFLVYDFNGDGRAELICKTAQGTVDGQGNYVNQAADETAIRNGNNRLVYVNEQGRVLSGAEYLTVFEGTTGRAIHTIWYNPNRGFTTGEVKTLNSTINSIWGDDYGNRCDRFLACVAHLDGQDKNASAVMCRGYYTRSYLWAVDFDGEKLTTKWLHGSISPTEVELTDAEGNKTTRTYDSNTSGISSGTKGVYYCTAYGQGCHSLAVGDVDDDGCDEIIYGSAAIDNDGQLLHTTGLGHGDALHLSDLMPDRPGLEVMMVHEEAPFGWSVRDAETGELLIHHTGSDDTGRGIAADINASSRGFEYWHSDDFNTNQNIYSSGDEVVGHFTKDYPFYNFRIYWDGDALDELFDKGAVNNGQWNRLLSAGNYGNSVTYGSKANPLLIADILGDWREEIVMFDKTDSCTINIFTTTTATKLRVPTLMHDHVYRMSVAWQNVGYNQPPHLGYYLPDFVASRFELLSEGAKEQSVVVGQPVSDIVCRLKNCTMAMLQYVYLNGERIKSYAAPDGFTFAYDNAAHRFTLSGTPTEVGDYEFLIRSSGDASGIAITDTIRIHSLEPSGIEAVRRDAAVLSRYYDLQGRPVEHPRQGCVYLIRRGQDYNKVICK